MTLSQEMKRRKRITELVPDVTQTLDLQGKDFKSIILNMLKQIKETMDRKLKESQRTISQQIENINKEKNYNKKSKRNFGAEKHKN